MGVLWKWNLDDFCLMIIEMFIEKFDCFITIEGNRSLGKCQTKGSKVLMFDGSWKNIEDIKVGDGVVSPQKDGTYGVEKVIETHSRFENNIYEVREVARNKRLLYKCSYNHLIPIWKYAHPRINGNPNRRRTIKKFVHWTAERISKTFTKGSHYVAFTTTGIDFGNKNPEIDPYVLGVWIGDGHFQKDLGVTTKDKEIIDSVKNAYPFDFLKGYRKKDNLATTYRFSILGKLAEQLSELGLRYKKSGDKFIPKECLLAPLEYRMNLLAGLIDTDGYVMKSKDNHISITTKSNILAENIKDLVFSLGGYSNIKKIRKWCGDFVGDYFDVSISFKNPKIIPLRTSKKERLGKIFFRDPRNIGIECIKSNPEMVYGFEVTGESKWYITDNWLVTHNSTLAIKICKKVNAYMKRIGEIFPEYKGRYEFSLQRQVNNSKKYKYILYKRDDILNFFNKWNISGIGDEAINVCFNREFYNEDQKNLIKLINMNRDHLNLFIMCVPQFQVLDNQVKNLCKIRLSVVRRGLAIIQTPNKIIYGRDKWDSHNNEKIEREWQMSNTKRPRYTRLTTFRGVLRFYKLSPKDEELYQSIKNSERNIIRKSLGINDEEEKDIVDEVVDKLTKGSIKNMEFIKGIAVANNQSVDQLRGKIRRKLDAKNMDQRISHYFIDKKERELGELEDHI